MGPTDAAGILSRAVSSVRCQPRSSAARSSISSSDLGSLSAGMALLSTLVERIGKWSNLVSESDHTFAQLMTSPRAEIRVLFGARAVCDWYRQSLTPVKSLLQSSAHPSSGSSSPSTWIYFRPRRSKTLRVSSPRSLPSPRTTTGATA